MAKVLEFSFNKSSSNKYSGLIFFRIDWLDLLALQVLKSLLQHHSLKTSILWCSAFFMVNCHICTWYWKNNTFDNTKFVSKVMSLFFNMLSRFVIAFLPSSKHLLISWLQSPKRRKSATVSIFSPSIWQEMIELDAMTLVFWMLSFKPAFSLSSSTFKMLFSSSLLSALEWYHLHIWYCYFSLPSWVPLVVHPTCTLHIS